MYLWLCCTASVTVQVKLYSELSTEVLRRREAKQYDAQSLMLAGKLLEQNPELYTVWNFRREALATVLDVSRLAP